MAAKCQRKSTARYTRHMATKGPMAIKISSVSDHFQIGTFATKS